ncbi:Nucleolar protein 13 [Vermiconidia calcicola]|uniref:Nucleolar protein 13 n=1 Tax=Vermiconidia calcicola TaxID=1690605 RepID=A0ACC3MAI6_9PEZI|nr:Nucleolar protein 13 [Vermiconidia calcicola]
MSQTSVLEKIIDDTTPDHTEKKRKRTKDVPTEGELEININLPEPPSKKAKRKEKKASTGKKPVKPSTDTNVTATTSKEPSTLASTAPALAKAYFDSTTTNEKPTTEAAKYGIWIGNLPFTTTRETLRDFLGREAGIEEGDILRLHLPGPTKKSHDAGIKQQNRGFAYIDFTSQETMQKAIACSEKLVGGRRCLIKDARSFEGRPEPQPPNPGDGGAVGKAGPGKPEPTKRVFVGNLSFEVTREDLAELFAPAGEAEDVFLATFEDSGKCKGFGWVRFASVAAAEAVVKGYIYRETLEDDGAGENGSESGDNSEVEIVAEKKQAARPKTKKEKVWFNRLRGRALRCEFAEDKQTRYKKRYGKDAKVPRITNGDAPVETDQTAQPNRAANGKIIEDSLESLASEAAAARQKQHPKGTQRKESSGKDARREERRKKHDAKKFAAAAAVDTPRASGAIVAGAGRKVTFD